MGKITLKPSDPINTVGLTPILQKSLNMFCGALPKKNPWVKSKFTDTQKQLKRVLQDHFEFQDPAKSAFADRVALYTLWRSMVHHYVGPSFGLSGPSQDLCKRCPPIGVTLSTHGPVSPFLSRYTCKHLLCPSCRMRKVLSTWNRFRNGISFEAGSSVDLVYFEVNRTFSFTGLGSGDFKLDVTQDLLKRFKSLLRTYGGVWSLGLTTKDRDITITAKCAAVCPNLSATQVSQLKEFASKANYVCALANENMAVSVTHKRGPYTETRLERLIARTLNTAVWPASFMLDYSSPVSTLFAAHLDLAINKQKTIGAFGPCTTMRKRLQHTT